MKTFPTEMIRNVALAGHPGSGKTTLAEAMLFRAGRIDRMGKTEEGNTASDHDPQEIQRQISIQTGVLALPHHDAKINVLDTPGTVDFSGEVRSAFKVAGGVICTVDATSGVAAGAEIASMLAEEFNLPLCFVVTKMDKEHADYESAVQGIRDTLGLNAVSITLPIGQEADFHGVLDLVEKDAILFDKGKGKRGPVPDDMRDAFATAEEALQEAAAEGKDELIEKYFAEGELSDEEVREGLHVGFLERRVFPVLCCSSTEVVGVERLMDFIVNVFPNPAEAQPVHVMQGDEEVEVEITPEGPALVHVFKTVSDAFTGRISHFKVIQGVLKDDVHLTNLREEADERLGHPFTVLGKKHEPLEGLAAGDIGAAAKLAHTQTGDTLAEDKNAPTVIPVSQPEPNTFQALHAKSKGDEDKIGIHIHKITEADPTLHVLRQGHLHQIVLAGRGDTHLEVALSRLTELAKVELELGPPRVDYRETIAKSTQGSYRHKKQSGGAGQFGEVHLRLEPAPEIEGYEFGWEVVGGNVPTKFQGACEKGVQQGMEAGFIAGCKAQGIKAIVFDGKDHPVDSKDIAFQIATYQCFRQVAAEAGPTLLEPIMEMEINVPETYMGDIMGDLNSKRGRILGNEPRGNRIVIRAHAPQAEIFTYARELRSITQGRGTFTTTFHGYERVPPEIQQKVIADHQAEKDDGHHH